MTDTKDQAVEYDEERLEEEENEPSATDKTGQKSYEELEAAYRTLQGKYNAEVPRLIERTRQLEELLAKTVSNTPQAVTQTPSIEEDEDISTLREDYPTIYNGLKKMTDYMTNKLKEELENRVSKLKEESVATTAKQFEAMLSVKVPNWRELDTDPRFLHWLSQKDEFSPFTRHQLLHQAYNMGDVDTVASFFIGFMKEHGGDKRQQYVSPNVSDKTVSENPNEGKTIRASYVRKFYNDLALGRLNMSPKEIEAEKKRIAKAIAENRVIND